MARPTSQSPSATATGPPHAPTEDRPVTEDLLVRNYDVERSSTLHVRAVDADSETVFEWTYYLDPGEFRSEVGVLEPGTYEITVEADGVGSETTTCVVGPDPAETALIETGNLTVAVSEGAY